MRGGYENPAIHRLSGRLCNKPHKIGRPPWRLSNPPAVLLLAVLTGVGDKKVLPALQLKLPRDSVFDPIFSAFLPGDLPPRHVAVSILPEL